MPQPTSFPDHIGEILSIPVWSAMSQCYDVANDWYWVYNENTNTILKILPGNDPTFFTTKYLGVRIIYLGGLVYTTLAMNLHPKIESTYGDYDRAMTIVKR